MFSHNHRRYKGGKRKGKAPIELLTGETLEGDWVELFIQHKREAEQNASVAPTPPLELVPSSQGPTPPTQTPDEQLTDLPPFVGQTAPYNPFKSLVLRSSEGREASAYILRKLLVVGKGVPNALRIAS